MDMRWLCATGVAKSARCNVERDKSKCERLASMTNGKGRNLPATSCRPTCAKHLAWKKPCPFSICAAFRQAIFRKRSGALLGEEALAGFSPTTVTRLLAVWQDEYKAWRKRSLTDTDYTYIWADGVHFNVRLEDDRLACLVIIGVRPDGVKEVIALEDGYRESTESWATLLRDLKQRGLSAPKLAIADGALGFWAALRQVYPETEEQRCWVHKIANVLDKLPKRLQPRAKSHLHEIMRAPDRANGAGGNRAAFKKSTRPNTPKRLTCLTQRPGDAVYFHGLSSRPLDSFAHYQCH